eukprot:TRINITY_DN27008_c0_g1_i2.p1 TRINITY_DN27008_c0_g1~~TRINITY_DN27008_c0_g1_i2.p1  ORF type:complete len:655 (-),score=91.28 TRINITY_DN27008_c0_g1_i2:3-1943(-)
MRCIRRRKALQVLTLKDSTHNAHAKLIRYITVADSSGGAALPDAPLQRLPNPPTGPGQGSSGGSTMPEAVRLALGKTDDSIAVAWNTMAAAAGEVHWGRSESALEQTAKADTKNFARDDKDIRFFAHMATMDKLAPNTKYYYKVGDGTTWSKTFSFMHRRSGAPYRHVLFGDLGAKHAYSLCKECSQDPNCDASVCKTKSAGLVSEATKADIFVHLGDMAYDMDERDNQFAFMRNIEQLSSVVPYMVTQGNHEAFNSACFDSYLWQFRHMPSTGLPATVQSFQGPTTNSLWYSWDFQLVHYAVISTEPWFANWTNSVADKTLTVALMLDWLDKDLQAVNSAAGRSKTPWLIVIAHRSIYCSCDSDCDEESAAIRKDVEPLLQKHGVDLFINGHQHNFERSYPMHQGQAVASSYKNPQASIYVVTGSAGNSELEEPFDRPQPQWSAYRSNGFGYSVMTVHNATHLQMQFVTTDPPALQTGQPLPYGSVIDDFMIEQYGNHHQLEGAPQQAQPQVAASEHASGSSTRPTSPLNSGQQPPCPASGGVGAHTSLLTSTMSDTAPAAPGFQNRADDLWRPKLLPVLREAEQSGPLPDTCDLPSLERSATGLPACLRSMKALHGQSWWHSIVQGLQSGLTEPTGLQIAGAQA